MICLKCNSPFKGFIKIDGKYRNLCSRKYCLNCSPFGRHNTKPIHIVRNKPTVNCKQCNRIYQKDKKKGHVGNTCNSCIMRNRILRVKTKLVKLKGGKCVICGYNKCIKALEFHHIDPQQKRFEISPCLGNTSLAVLIEEINKCMLVCSNCHRELEYKQNLYIPTV